MTTLVASPFASVRVLCMAIAILAVLRIKLIKPLSSFSVFSFSFLALKPLALTVIPFTLSGLISPISSPVTARLLPAIVPITPINPSAFALTQVVPFIVIVTRSIPVALWAIRVPVLLSVSVCIIPISLHVSIIKSTFSIATIFSQLMSSIVMSCPSIARSIWHAISMRSQSKVLPSISLISASISFIIAIAPGTTSATSLWAATHLIQTAMECQPWRWLAKS